MLLQVPHLLLLPVAPLLVSRRSRECRAGIVVRDAQASSAMVRAHLTTWLWASDPLHLAALRLNFGWVVHLGAQLSGGMLSVDRMTHTISASISISIPNRYQGPRLWSST